MALIVPVDGLDSGTVKKLREAIAHVLSSRGEAADGADDGISTGDESAAPSDAPPIRGWSTRAAAELIRRLRAKKRPVQATAIATAAHSGGYIDRDTVYTIGRYPKTRALTGFTKPIAGTMREMVSEGLLPADAGAPILPEYDPTNPSYQRARGFRMPADVATVFAHAVPRP